MKIRAVLIVALGLMAVGVFAAPPAKKAAPKGATTEETPAIKGIEIPRAKGGFLGIQVVNNSWVLSFYDADKNPIPADVSKASLRWPVKYQKSDERVMLNPSADGKTLTSPRTVRPPHDFRLYILLFVEGQEDPVENYQIDFHD
jgi:hypothetical protein